MLPVLFDLFSGAGGTGTGFHRAGFYIVGFDKADQPNYPFTFHRRDAMEVLTELAAIRRSYPGANYVPYLGYRVQAISAGPPCQAYGSMSHRLTGDYPKLIAPVRELLREIGLPYIIENVNEAPLLDPVTLCGTMFPKLRVLRHRKFETNFPVRQPAHPTHPIVFSYRRGRPGRFGNQNEMFVQVTGGGNATVRNKRSAMGIHWMLGKELNEAIPPAYSEYIGKELMTFLSSRSG